MTSNWLTGHQCGSHGEGVQALSSRREGQGDETGWSSGWEGGVKCAGRDIGPLLGWQANVWSAPSLTIPPTAHSQSSQQCDTLPAYCKCNPKRFVQRAYRCSLLN